MLLASYMSLQSRLAGRRGLFSREGDRRRPSAEAMGLQIALTNCRQVTISISQLFQIQDLLRLPPDELLATRLRDVVNDVGKLRRTLNPSGFLQIDGLGRLEPVARIGQTRDRESFWYAAVPDLRDPAYAKDPPLTMIPFQLSPFPQLESLKFAPERWVEDLVKDTLGPATQQVKVASVRGTLRIYPTGVGVVRLVTALDFAGPILVELIASVARAIEDTVFVDPEGQSRKVESFLSDLVNQVAASLFKDPGDFDRRWRPPDTIIRFQQGAFVPEDHTRELAYAMWLSPGNEEALPSLRARIEKKLRSQQWINEGVLAVPGHRVFLLVRNIDPKHKAERATRLLKFLAETHELTSVALHTYRVFTEDLQVLRERGLPNDDWLPGTDNFRRLELLIDTIGRAVSAVRGIPKHLQRTGRGILTAVAREVWDAEAKTVLTALDDELLHIAAWIKDSGLGAEPEMKRLSEVMHRVATPRPFTPRTPAGVTQKTEAEELLGNEILDGSQLIDEMVAAEAPDFDAIDAEILRVESARRRLFEPLD